MTFCLQNDSDGPAPRQNVGAPEWCCKGCFDVDVVMVLTVHTCDVVPPSHEDLKRKPEATLDFRMFIVRVCVG